MSPRLALAGAALAALSGLPALAGCASRPPKPPVYPRVEHPWGLVVQDLVVPDEGPPAATGDRATIRYAIALEGGTVVDSSFERSQSLTVTLGAGDVPAGLELGLLGMRLGGRRRIEVPAELGYGAEGHPPRIPPDAALVFEVELMDLEKVGDAARAGDSADPP